MPTTIELLERALAKSRASVWCRALNVHQSTLCQAKKRGRLSPALASNLAMEMGADPIFWAAVAAAEAEPAGPLRERLEQNLERHKSTVY